MSEPTKFIVHGGWIISPRDGQRHYISARKCCEAYGMVIRDQRVRCLLEHRDQDGRADESSDMGMRLSQYVHLYPREAGDYREWFAALTEPF